MNLCLNFHLNTSPLATPQQLAHCLLFSPTSLTLLTPTFTQTSPQKRWRTHTVYLSYPVVLTYYTHCSPAKTSSPPTSMPSADFIMADRPRSKRRRSAPTPLLPLLPPPPSRCLASRMFTRPNTDARHRTTFHCDEEDEDTIHPSHLPPQFRSDARIVRDEEQQ